MDNDVIIMADPYDTTDHQQDDYNIVPAQRFYYMWFCGSLDENHKRIKGLWMTLKKKSPLVSFLFSLFSYLKVKKTFSTKNDLLFCNIVFQFAFELIVFYCQYDTIHVVTPHLLQDGVKQGADVF